MIDCNDLYTFPRLLPSLLGLSPPLIRGNRCLSYLLDKTCGKPLPITDYSSHTHAHVLDHTIRSPFHQVDLSYAHLHYPTPLLFRALPA